MSSQYSRAALVLALFWALIVVDSVVSLPIFVVATLIVVVSTVVLVVAA